MFSKVILYITAQQLTASVWRFGKLVKHARYLANGEGHDALAAFVEQHASLPIHILVDAVEEDYHLESFPHTMGQTRQSLLARKLGQVYRGRDFKAASYIGRTKEKRKDDQFLFVALSNADFLQDWLSAIASKQGILAGVYPVSLLGEHILKRMRIDAPHVLLSEVLPSGLRHSYFDHQRMRLSRLAAGVAAEQQSTALLMSETEKTRQYLTSQRLINKDTPMQMLVLSLGQAQAAIIQTIQQDLGLPCQGLDLTPLAKQLGLHQTQLAQVPELLYIALLAKGVSPLNLASGNQIHAYQVNRLRQGMFVTASLLLGIGIAYAAWNLVQQQQSQQAYQQAVIDTRVQEDKYQQASKTFIPAPIAGADLKRAVELAQYVGKLAQSPEQVMQVLGASLADQPEIKINRIHWIQTDDPHIQDKAENSVPINKNVENTTMADLPAGWHRVVFVDGEINHFNGDYRAALASVNHWLEKLQTNAQMLRVDMLQAPVNLGSYAELSGTTTDQANNMTNSAPFKLRLVMRNEGEAK